MRSALHARFTRRAGIASCLTMQLTYLAGGRAQSHPATEFITGTVVDGETGAPLRYANVVVIGTIWGTMVGDGSRFRIGPLPAGSYAVRAVLVAYTPDTVEVDVRSSSTAGPLEFRLQRAPWSRERSSIRSQPRIVPGCGCGGLAPERAAPSVAQPGAWPDNAAGLPQRRLELLPSFPNPFNPTTEIRFVLPRRGWVSIDVFDVRGRRMRRLVGSTQDGGRHSVHWDGRLQDGSAAASGVFFVRLRTAHGSATDRVVLVR